MKSGWNNNGRIVWENSQVVAIATGFKTRSHNLKVAKHDETSSLIQIWLIVKRMHPTEAINSGADSAICFNCDLRKLVNPATGKAERGCYVRSDAIASIWRCYSRGGYRYADLNELTALCAGRYVRFGAYGEPVLLPLPMVRAIAEVASEYSGYTHRWSEAALQGYRHYFMASTTPANYRQAWALGWRTFTVRPRGSAPLADHAVCPASDEFKASGKFKVWAVRPFMASKVNAKLTCEDCGQCNGLKSKSRSKQIEAHGSGAAYAR